MTGIMKAQIDWIPLTLGAGRPTQGKTLAVMQVSGTSFLKHCRARSKRDLTALSVNPYCSA